MILKMKAFSLLCSLFYFSTARLGSNADESLSKASDPPKEEEIQKDPSNQNTEAKALNKEGIKDKKDKDKKGKKEDDKNASDKDESGNTSFFSRIFG